jgi:hypothetical protein
MTSLNPAHTAHLGRFKIPPELLADAGVQSGDDFAVRELLAINGRYEGEDLGGIIFPFLDPVTGNRTGNRVRLDHPISKMKYLTETGCRHIYFPPGVSDYLRDTTITVVVVEADKSALALRALADRTGRKLLPIAIGGDWGWRRKVGNRPLPDGGTEPETGPSPDLDLVVWPGRRVIIALDSNAATNREVHAARRALARELAERGAVVAFAEIPADDGVNGPDDLIAVRGDDVMLQVLDTAASAIITVRAGDLPAAVDEAERVLLNHCERLGVFQRAGELVRVVRLPEANKSGGLKRPAGITMLQPLAAVALMEMWERLIHFERRTKSDEARTIDCPQRLAATYLARVGQWRIPLLVGTILTPIIRLDGSVLARAGYDAESGLYLATDDEWPQIPANPSKEDARDALTKLMEPFSEFPFLAAEDKSCHAAAILTAIERRVLDACPLFGYSAPQQRYGKSLLAESVAIIATGKAAAASAASRETEEFKKAILAALREGHLIINLDNVTHVLDSPDLSRALTQREYGDRVLGETRNLQVPTNVLWTATGNNLTFKGDLSVRALLCRIGADLDDPEQSAFAEKPEARSFTITDLKKHLTEHRHKLVINALTILRAYHLAQRPDQKLPAWGGFDQWSAWIRSAIVWAGGADPCLTREEISFDDPDREAAAALLAALSAYYNGEKFTTAKLVQDATALNTELYSALQAVAGQRGTINPHLVGWWCRHWRSRVVNGLCLQRVNPETAAVGIWSVKKVANAKKASR